jgi:hypothetical protein
MAAITVPNTAPAIIIVLSEEMIERIDNITHRSAALTLGNRTDKEQAERLAKEMRALKTEISDKRKEQTRVLDDVTAAAIAAEKTGVEVLDLAWAALVKRIDAFVLAENKRLEEERRKAKEEADRKQAEENKRADDERKRLAEQAALDAPPGEEPSPVPVVAALPVHVPERYVPPPLKMATRAKTDYVLEYINRDLVPAFSASGHELRRIDETALKAYLKGLPAGKRDIAGAVRLVEVESRAAKG